MHQQPADTGFPEALLEMMIQCGFGTLPAREMAIETLPRMLQYRPEWSRKNPSDYELARLLRISPGKVAWLLG